MMELPKRKPLRLHGYDYSQDRAYFVTICTKNRAELFGKIPVVRTNISECPCVQLTELGKIVDAAIFHNNNRDGISIDHYVIMPNHIHMIVVFASKADNRSPKTDDRERSPLQIIIRNMKAYVTRQIGFSPWQKSFHDHIIRNEDEYNRIADTYKTTLHNGKKIIYMSKNVQCRGDRPGRPSVPAPVRCK